MSKLTDLENDLSKATAAHAALQDELPQFYGLLTENEAEAQNLKTERAPLDVQAQARGRVAVAREMLEQHRADIQTAQAEIARLGAALHHETLLLEMAEQARRAAKHRAKLDKAFSSGLASIYEVSDQILKAWVAENKARDSFAETGSQLVPRFRDPNGHSNFTEREAKLAESLEQELKARGVLLEAVSDGATGSFSYLDKHPSHQLPHDAVSMVLWEAIRLLTKDQPDAHNLQRLTPKPNPYTTYALLTDFPKGL